jgi:GntR family transcriptional regulator
MLDIRRNDMEFDDRAPIYTQIMDLVKRRIAVGELRVGQQLPSVRDLAQQVVVNPNTVQKAYLELEREGYVATQRGMGTFVSGGRGAVDLLRQGLARGIVETYVAGMRSLEYDAEEIAAMAAEAARKETK